ncbi:enoyl-CoA hydratase/isomerase family protein [Salinicola tamaricis]|uniref:enoyl-CoA hydratase/isomerase family protein n=1 Tax=Salinicola tamaricis TaxID=1771309 RepID=UPI000D0A7BE2|nr:enoyl-CoA hydratase/isomerase family protein [Salinicola tamaricis]
MPDAHQPPRVELDYVDDIAVVTLDNPPVNSGNQRIRQGILDALAAIDTQRVRAVVLQGAGKHLMAGADLRELDQPATAPSLPEVTQALEAFPLPIVAVVRGHTLGGGLELALACDARLATPGASLGLPEVNVGIIPGAGGTQRLPRLVGVDHALTMIVAGKPIDAATAHQWGLVDQMLDTTERADQEVAALDFARRMPADKRRVSARSVPPFDADQSARLQAQQVRRQRGLPAAAEAADAG